MSLHPHCLLHHMTRAPKTAHPYTSTPTLRLPLWRLVDVPSAPCPSAAPSGRCVWALEASHCCCARPLGPYPQSHHHHPAAHHHHTTPHQGRTVVVVAGGGRQRHQQQHSLLRQHCRQQSRRLCVERSASCRAQAQPLFSRTAGAIWVQPSNRGGTCGSSLLVGSLSFVVRWRMRFCVLWDSIPGCTRPSTWLQNVLWANSVLSGANSQVFKRRGRC